MPPKKVATKGTTKTPASKTAGKTSTTKSKNGAVKKTSPSKAPAAVKPVAETVNSVNDGLAGKCEVVPGPS